jgi:hypothetical protein
MYVLTGICILDNGIAVLVENFPHGTREISFAMGYTVSLECKNAVGIVNWLKDDGPLPDDCEESTLNDRCYHANERLTIKNLTEDYVGSYKCQANNTESLPLAIKLSPDINNEPTASAVATTRGTNGSISTQSTRISSPHSVHNPTDSLLTRRGTTVAPTASNIPESETGSDNSVNTGLVAGVTIGVILVVVLLIGGIYFVYKKKWFSCLLRKYRRSDGADINSRSVRLLEQQQEGETTALQTAMLNAIRKGHTEIKEGQSALMKEQTEIKEGQSALMKEQTEIKEGQSALMKEQTEIKEGQSALMKGQTALMKGQAAIQEEQADHAKSINTVRDDLDETKTTAMRIDQMVADNCSSPQRHDDEDSA